jgi:uncharacterized protein YgiM (DUF1202 family)
MHKRLAMRCKRYAGLSAILSAAFVTAALHGAAAQGAAPPPPPPGQGAPPEQNPPPPEQNAPPAPGASSAVTHSSVNLRNGPGTSYTVVTLIPAGSSVEVSGCKSGWCQVTFEGNNGYIIETSIASGAPAGAARRAGPPPGYAGPAGPGGPPPPGYGAPPPGYYPPPPGYYPPPPGYYYGYGPYYGPYWGWRRGYWWR